MKNKLKSRITHNPLQTVASFPRRPIAPFVRCIQTTESARTYTFCPTKETQFEVSVLFPIEEYGELRISLQGAAETTKLQNAIEFIHQNESEFVGAFFGSRKKEGVEVNEAEFSKL